MRLYHSTRPDNARAILRDGFLDGDQFVSDTRLPRKSGDSVLAIDWNGTAQELAGYAYNKRVWPPNGNDYREWRVSGERLNQCPRPMLVSPGQF